MIKNSLATFPYTIYFAVIAILIFGRETAGQQPFYTDNADVTAKGVFHFQFSNEYDLLQRTLYPAKSQNTITVQLSYGIFKNVEIGITAPLLAIHNAANVSPRTPFGIGDATIHVKYNFYKESETSIAPALTLNMLVQFPTGDTSRSLGSGLTDYYLNGILQKSVTSKTKLRLNSGVLFAGNTVNGVLGIRSTRGRVFTAGGSLVRQFTKKLDLGAELTGALTGNFQLSKGQLQILLGGNYQLKKGFTLDFGIVAGRFSASPRAGALLGFSYDFK